jgi:hypothetical protein
VQSFNGPARDRSAALQGAGRLLAGARRRHSRPARHAAVVVVRIAEYAETEVGLCMPTGGHRWHMTARAVSGIQLNGTCGHEGRGTCPETLISLTEHQWCNRVKRIEQGPRARLIVYLVHCACAYCACQPGVIWRQARQEAV